MEQRSRLWRLIDANVGLWGGEAEVVRTYWSWPGRSRATDLLWLARQAYKEYWDGFVPHVERLACADCVGADARAAALAHAQTACEELAHYCAFADAHDLLCGDTAPPLDPRALQSAGDWPENRALMRLRAEHRRLHGEIGARAHAFTEGGYCTLYTEGLRRAGRGDADDAIARACALVLEDEFDHMLTGIAGLDGAPLADEGWELLTRLTVEQSRARIRMRNAQFGWPVTPEREAALCAGLGTPVRFDYARAGIVAPPARDHGHEALSAAR